MLFDNRHKIHHILDMLAEETRLSAVRISEDPRNAKLVQKFQDIYDRLLKPAEELASNGSEAELEEAVDLANEGLIKIFEINVALWGRGPDGERLPEDQWEVIYPSPIYSGRENGKTVRFEILKDENGQDVRNYDLTITFKDKYAIEAAISNIVPDTATMLFACGADITPIAETYRRQYKADIVETDNIVPMSNLRMALQSTATRISPYDIDETHPNYEMMTTLRELDYRIETAAGGGLVAAIVEMVDPAEALSAPPPPTADIVMSRYDGIFTELHNLLKAGWDKVALLRSTPQCRESIRGSFQKVAKCLPFAVACMEDAGMEFPHYHAVADLR